MAPIFPQAFNSDYLVFSSSNLLLRLIFAKMSLWDGVRITFWEKYGLLLNLRGELGSARVVNKIQHPSLVEIFLKKV